MIAVVVGSTGLTGAALIRQLVADPAITRVVAVARRPLDDASPKLATVRVADLAAPGALDAVAAQLRGDLYFCCLGTTIRVAGSRARFSAVDHGAVLAFARVARAHDARSLALVSAAGADARSTIFYNAVKGRTEDDVRALGLRSLVVMRPALLVGERREVRTMERLAAAVLVPLARLLPAVGRRAVTPVDRLAARMLSAAKAATPGVHVIPARAI